MNCPEMKYNTLQLFYERWALVTAGSIEDCNTMTIAWDSMRPMLIGLIVDVIEG